MDQKPSWLVRLQSRPQLTPRDFWLTAVPLALWAIATHLRPLLIHPSCFSIGCEISHVFFIDRPSIGNLSGEADFYSYVIQNSAWALAAFGPGLYQTVLFSLGITSPGPALAAYGADFVIFLQSWFINGFLNEITRLVAARPRPYLYANPASPQKIDPKLLIDPQNYTSFYSGHTSFVTVACLSLLFTLLGRRAPTGLLITTALFSECMIVSTAIFRILAGRHFLTDVLVAIVMGSLSALLVAAIHRPVLRSR